MLRLAQETTDIADNTITALERQNEELRRQQEEVAGLNNDLNTAEKKMKAIKSGWGGLANIGSSKKKNQYTKQLDKWEHERDKGNFKQDAALQKAHAEEHKQHLRENEEAIDQTTKGLRKEQHQAKKDSRLETKAIVKGNADERDQTVNYGGFVFEERIEGTGPKHQAEQDLEHLAVYTEGLKTKSFTMGQQIGEGKDRINNIQINLETASVRTQELNNNMQRYVKKNS